MHVQNTVTRNNISTIHHVNNGGIGRISSAAHTLQRMERRQLTESDLAAAKRLRAIWDQKKGELGLTQEKAAEAMGYSTQGAVGHYLNGRAPLNTDAIFKFANLLRVSPIDIRPELESVLREIAQEPDPIEHLPSRPAVEVRLFNASASMGLGLPQPDHETVVDILRLSKDWVHANLPNITSPRNLAALTAYGDSMAPTFADGDILMVDRGITDIRLDAVYVLAYNQELYVKRIQRRITDGAVIIRSDNPVYEPMVVTNGNRESLQVLGRVVWAWKGQKL